VVGGSSKGSWQNTGKLMFLATGTVIPLQ